MIPEVDPTRAFWHTQGIARALGVNFSEAMRLGRIDTDRFARLVATCCLCPESGACLTWLGTHGAGAASAPGFCPNAGQIEALAPGRRRPGGPGTATPQNPV